MSSVRLLEKSIDDLKDTLDYREAYTNRDKGPIHIGSLKGPIGLIMEKDILEKEEKSEYFGKVFSPNRKSREDYDGAKNDNWAYEKNMAYMAGAIDARRPVILTTNIEWYGNPNNMGVTNDEILWLATNGYTFKPDPTKPENTIAESTNEPSYKLKIFRDEDGIIQREMKRQMIKEINFIKNDVIAQRELILKKNSTEMTFGNITNKPEIQVDAIARVAALEEAKKFVPKPLRELAIEQQRAKALASSSVPVPVSTNQVPARKTHIQSFQQSNTADIAKRLFGSQASNVLKPAAPILNVSPPTTNTAPTVSSPAPTQEGATSTASVQVENEKPKSPSNK